ncbi:MAG: DUF3306 domain-containing protein [Burkholderiaceae bacterium]|nr:DUF3306 domain-containing protein [Burkholderiaceae bacterium]
MTREEGFLGRWSRRKAHARADKTEPPHEPEAAKALRSPDEAARLAPSAAVFGPTPTPAPTSVSATPVSPSDAPSAPSPETDEPPTDASNPIDASLPPLESLDANSDYAQFMQPGVSDEIQRLALRRLFRLPGLVVRDGLDDYDEDFTEFEPLGDIVTADMRHRMALERERLAQADAHDEVPADDRSADATGPQGTRDADTPATAHTTAPTAVASADAPADDAAEPRADDPSDSAADDPATSGGPSRRGPDSPPTDSH